MGDDPSSINLATINFSVLEKSFDNAQDYKALQRMIVNAPFEQKLATASLFLAFIVLLVVNKKSGLIERVALSDTELAHNTTEVSFKAFEDIKIPVDHTENIIVQSIKSHEPRDTTDWYYTFTPALTGQQARINQASGGISYTAIYPLDIPPQGALSFSYYQYPENIDKTQHDFMKQYAVIVSKAITAKYSVK
ncbi:MAG: hypothetical protein JWM81_373 [Candidatus Saccharibacteria bacterium]|nr:hypothetical protein [Candidatus Saccharibacteria bacterium]